MAERAEQIKKSLDPEQAKKELEKLAQQAQSLESLDQLADSLGKMADSMQNPEDSQANPGETAPNTLEEQVAQARRMLDELAQSEAEQQMLDQMLDDVGKCRGGMCRKPGQGQGEGQGDGLGNGQGEGDRPIAEDQTRSRQSRARSQVTKGKSFVTGKADGSIFKGASTAEMQEAVTAAAREADDAVTRQPIPAEYKEHTRDYFQKLHGQIERE
jgi:hypothetical protein